MGHRQAKQVRLRTIARRWVGKRDFYRQLCVALGLSPSATAAAVFFALSTHVQQLRQERIHPVFLLDEAHLLQADTLDHLHTCSIASGTAARSSRSSSSA